MCCVGAIPLTQGQFGTSYPPDVLASVQCIGTEHTLLGCNYSTAVSTCDELNDAGVACQGT